MIDLLNWGPRVVGAILLVAALFKAASPFLFRAHIYKLDLLPPKSLIWLVPLIILFEALLGAALMVGLHPQWVWPATVVILFALTAFTWWSTRSGRVEDCGCYQGLMEITPAQSMGLNLIYVAFVLLALWFRNEPPADETWRWIVMATAGGVATVLFLMAIWRAEKGQSPLIDLSPIKLGKRWHSTWLPSNAPDLEQGEKLVVFLSTSCPACKHWVRILNLIHHREDLPTVVGAIISDPSELMTFVFEEGVRFPVLAARRNLVWQTLPAVPTAVQLIDGRIQGRWSGAFQESFMERIRPGIPAKARERIKKMTLEAVADHEAADPKPS